MKLVTYKEVRERLKKLSIMQRHLKAYESLAFKSNNIKRAAIYQGSRAKNKAVINTLLSLLYYMKLSRKKGV